jgi:DNA-3-methyladenine glycosylase II
MLLAPIPVRAPFPWHALLNYLSYRLIPGIELTQEGAYVRHTEQGVLRVTYDERRQYLLADAQGIIEEEVVTSRIANLFDVNFDAASATAHLRNLRLFARRLQAVPGMRPLGAWSPFELCVRTILGQQVTVAAAGTLMRRWVERCGSITPSQVLAADLAQIGMPTKRIEFICELARAVLDGRVDFAAPWKEIEAALKSVAGFGPWTRAYLAIRLGRQPDELPSSDLGLIRAANVSSPKELLQMAEAWRPYRSYAATYLWAVADVRDEVTR